MKDIPQLYLRLALSAAYLVFGLDRLGLWGEPQSPGVSWGDWPHFQAYARQVMAFLPSDLADVLAIIATICELVFGVLLFLGKWTRYAAIGSGLLSLFFACSMAISFGIISPLSYSVFAVSAGSFLMATQSSFRWSVDEMTT